jgi:tRNA dimethylallyltransferase
MLDRRIEKRLRDRLDAGMTDEVADFLGAGGDPEIMLTLGLEFKHICMYLTGASAELGLSAAAYATADDMARQLNIEIRRFSKRQTTWFKRNKSILWLDMSGDHLAQAYEATERFLRDAPG